MKRRLSSPLAARSAVLALVAACRLPAVGPDYEPPADTTPPAYRYGDGDGAPPRRGDWWNLFADPELDRIVRRVRAQNHELLAAVRRIEEARAIVRVDRAGALPQVALEPGFRRSRASDEVETFPGAPSLGTQNVFSLPATLDWELDLFGRIRRTVEARTAEAEATVADFEALQLLLEAEAASEYLSIRALDREIAFVERSVEARRRSTALVRERFELGAVSELDLAQAETQLSVSESDFAGLLRERATRENALAVLVGEPASAFTLPVRILEGSPPPVPSGVPSEILRTRPDIRRAERLVAAENARIGVAEAAFYPSFSLSGDFGVEASEASDLFESGARIWSINPRIYLPLFQGGRNRAALDLAQARYEEVLEGYQQAVLEGIADVETALSSWKYLDRQTAAQARAVVAARRARDISFTQYEVGTVDYLTVLDAERTALDTERQEARLIGAQYLNAVQLLRSLGGRW